MFSPNHIHRILAAAAPIVLVCAAAIPQGAETRAVPVPPAIQEPVAPWLETDELNGRAVVTTKDVEDPARPATVGKVTDAIVDTHNFTVPFLVVDVEDGPRTAVAWHAARWDAEARSFTVDASVAEMRSRAEIEPDHLDRLIDAGTGAADTAAKQEGDAAEKPLPRLVLASRIPDLATQARDSSAFGKLHRVLVDTARGDVPVMVVAVEDHLHVVPGALASLVRTGEKAVALRFDRDAETLRATPRLDREDVSLSDPLFRAQVFRAVGLTPRPEPGTARPRR